MLLKTVENKILKEFPSLSYSVNVEDHIISINEMHPEVGSIDIQDDIDELIVFVGNFTHMHIDCYDESKSKEEKEESMATSITEFLHDLFNNEIVLWGSHDNGGGFYHKKEATPDELSFSNKHKLYQWSGPICS